MSHFEKSFFRGEDPEELPTCQSLNLKFLRKTIEHMYPVGLVTILLPTIHLMLSSLLHKQYHGTKMALITVGQGN